MRRAGRRQHGNLEPAGGERGGKTRRGPAIEQHATQRGKLPQQGLEVVCLGGPDIGVEAALPLAGGQYVPQADRVGQKPVEPARVRQVGQRFVQNRAENRPELVAWMSVVLTASQRCTARKAAQDQRLDPRIDHRREAGQQGERRQGGRDHRAVAVTRRAFRRGDRHPAASG